MAPRGNGGRGSVSSTPPGSKKDKEIENKRFGSEFRKHDSFPGIRRCFTRFRGSWGHLLTHLRVSYIS